MKKIIILFLLVVVVSALGFWLYTTRSSGGTHEFFSSTNAVPEKNDSSRAVSSTSETEDGVPVVSDLLGAPQDVSNLIHVTSISESQEISSPVVIEGEARGSWYAEGRFSALVLDEEGRILGTTLAVAKGEVEGEEFIPFIATIDFTLPSVPTGFLVLEKNNASGLKENAAVLKVPVRFSQKVRERITGGCKVTGCSGQVCADQDMVTDCLYKEEYMCYQKATCERQSDGQCGWTETKELKLCVEQFAG